MTKKDKNKYRKMWSAVVRHRDKECLWCRDTGRIPDPVLFGKSNLLLEFSLNNGVALCRTCNCFRKGKSAGGNAQYFLWIHNKFGADFLEGLEGLSRMTSKSNPTLLQAELEILEEEYAKLKGKL